MSTRDAVNAAKGSCLPSIAHSRYSQLDAIRNLHAQLTQDAIEQCDLTRAPQDDFHAKLKLLAEVRIQLHAPHSRQWHHALSLLSQPEHVPTSVKMYADLADQLACQCGDHSHDMRWYFRRTLIASAFASAELYAVMDSSELLKNTVDYFSRRVMEMKSMETAHDHGIKAAGIVAVVVANAIL